MCRFMCRLVSPQSVTDVESFDEAVKVSVNVRVVLAMSSNKQQRVNETRHFIGLKH